MDGKPHGLGDLRAIRHLHTTKVTDKERTSLREKCFKKQSWKGIHGAMNQSLP